MTLVYRKIIAQSVISYLMVIFITCPTFLTKWIVILMFPLQEVFKSDFYTSIPISQVLGKCYVMSVKDYFKSKPEVSCSFILFFRNYLKFIQIGTKKFQKGKTICMKSNALIFLKVECETCTCLLVVLFVFLFVFS